MVHRVRLVESLVLIVISLSIYQPRSDASVSVVRHNVKRRLRDAQMMVFKDEA